MENHLNRHCLEIKSGLLFREILSREDFGVAVFKDTLRPFRNRTAALSQILQVPLSYHWYGNIVAEK